MLVLGIETSCDETGVAVYDTEPRAARARAALAGRDARERTAASCRSSRRATTSGACCRSRSACWPRRASTLADLDGIAYTQGPGSPARCWSAPSVASALGFALGKPVRRRPSSRRPPAVAAARRRRSRRSRSWRCSCRAGTRQLFDVAGVGRYRLLGDTQDDAAGEAFDKTAKLLGPALSRRPGARAAGRSGTRRAPCRCRGRCSTAAISTSAFQRPQDRRADARAAATAAAPRIAARRRARPTSRASSSTRSSTCSSRKRWRRSARPGRDAAGRRGRRRRQSRIARAPASTALAAARRRGVLSRSRVLHRQRRDDRAGRRAAPARGDVDRLCVLGAAALGSRVAVGRGPTRRQRPIDAFSRPRQQLPDVRAVPPEQQQRDRRPSPTRAARCRIRRTRRAAAAARS